MARSLNKVSLIGNLGGEPEIRYTPSGGAVANISIATSDSWKDKNTGQMQERTEWHRIAIFGKLAEIVQQYLHKGSKVYIEGKLQTRKWQDKEGKDRYTTEIVVDSFTGNLVMLDGPQGSGGAIAPHNTGSQSRPLHTESSQQMPTTPMQQQPKTPAPTQEMAMIGADQFDDDIPF